MSNNYEDMSDFEINSLVAKEYLGLFVDAGKSKGKLDSDTWLIDSEGLLRWTNYNPCHDPKHAWPIIVENRISILIPDDGTLSSESVVIDRHIGYDDDEIHCSISHSTQNDNPLRAAMICFLKVKDDEQ